MILEPEQVSTKGRDEVITKQPEAIHSQQNEHYEKKIAKLQVELRKKEEELENSKYEFKEMKGTLDQIARRHKIFYQFPKLPTELRHLIFSKFSLFERVAAAKSCPEMASFFRNNRIKVEVKMSLEEENGKAYVKILYRQQDYVEMYKIPNVLVASVERDLASSRGCRCSYFCDENRFELYKIEESVPQIRYFECTVGKMSTVFDTFALLKVEYLEVKTAPVGGLVDLLQPTGLHPEPVTVNITWHLQDDVVYKRNDPNFVVRNWGKWLDYLHPERISIDDNTGKYVSETESDSSGYFLEAPEVFVHKDLYDLPAMCNVKRVHQECSVDINFRQLMCMKATTIYLHSTKSKYLTAVDLLEFYKIKIKAWVLAPDTEFYFSFDSAEKTRNPPYLDFERLLENVSERLESPDFRVYPNYNLYNRKPEFCAKSITIRSMKTGQSLVVTTGSLSTRTPDEYFGKHVWPEKHGL